MHVLTMASSVRSLEDRQSVKQANNGKILRITCGGNSWTLVIHRGTKVRSKVDIYRNFGGQFPSFLPMSRNLSVLLDLHRISLCF